MLDLKKYKGQELKAEHLELLAFLESNGFDVIVTGANRTIRIKKRNRNNGYINSTVLRYKGILGYRFELFGGKDACPKHLEGKIEELFSNLYEVKNGWICHYGTGSNRENKYLIITDLKLAKKISEAPNVSSDTRAYQIKGGEVNQRKNITEGEKISSKRDIVLNEEQMETLVAEHPDEFLEPGWKLHDRQGTYAGRRFDLVFKDDHNRTLIVEIKKGVLDRKHVGQLVEYYGLLKQQGPFFGIELLLIANIIPFERREFLHRVGIETQEVHPERFFEVSRKFKYEFAKID